MVDPLGMVTLRTTFTFPDDPDDSLKRPVFSVRTVQPPPLGWFSDFAFMAISIAINIG
jgi:hypothetical protein